MKIEIEIKELERINKENSSKDNKITELENQLNDCQNFNNEWIAINDKKPDDYQKVIYLLKGEESFENKIGIGYFVFSQSRHDDVSHWMNLPQKPV